MRRAILGFCCLLLAATVNYAYAGNPRDANDAPRPKLQVPYAATTPQLKADLNDPAWKDAAEVPELTVSLGKAGEGLEPVATEVKVLWDEENLYVRFICNDPDEIYAPFTGRDADHYQGDVVEIFFDPKGDQRQYFEMQVNPNNYVLDLITLVTGEPKFTPALTFEWGFVGKDVWYDRNWTIEGFETATSRIKDGDKETGWVVDAKIPAASTLKRVGTRKFKADMTMRINFLRYEYKTQPEKNPDGSVARKLIAMNWAPVLFGCPHVSPAAMGYITLLPPAEKK